MHEFFKKIQNFRYMQITILWIQFYLKFQNKIEIFKNLTQTLVARKAAGISGTDYFL